MSFYDYTKRYYDIGGGAQEYALVRPGLAISPTAYGPRYNVRGSINPVPGASPYAPKMGPINDLKANGVYLSGDLALQSLSDFQKGGST